MRLMYFSLAVLMVCLLSSNVQAQSILDKAKEKAARIAREKLGNKGGSNEGQQGGSQEQGGQQAGQQGSGGNNGGGNSGGSRKMAPPDVMKNLSEAQTAIAANNYNETRFSIEQALLGLEIEIGHEILNSLPKEIRGLKFDEPNDQVVASAIGFVGLQVVREYGDGSSEKYAKVSVMNNGTMASATSYTINSNYIASDGSQKIVKVGTHRGLLQMTGDNTYKISVPFGQNCVLVMDANNVNGENDMLALASLIDMDKILTLLGEK